PDEATAYMNGPEYAADPIGPSFDAAALAAAFRSGTPDSELRTRAWALKSPQLSPFELLTT
ncbi:MAG: biphenyl 2,3-dioxygenase, partial [Actinobacteria bacterium]|nr:biphenyl 2,3-dioxygenase [Actinomycetota bacterium]